MRNYLLVGLMMVASMSYAQESANYENLSYDELDSLIDYKGQEGRFQEAIEISDILISKAQENQIDTALATGLNYKGIFTRLLGDYDASQEALTRALEIRKRVYGTSHELYASTLINIGSLHQDLGDYNAALSAKEEVLRIRKDVYGDNHPAYAEITNNLASLLEHIGDYDKALPLYLKTKEIDEATYGNEHPYYAITINNLGGLYYRMGNLNQAIVLLEQAKSIKEKIYGDDHPSYLRALNNLATMYSFAGEYESALDMFFSALETKEKIYGKNHPSYAKTLSNISRLHTKNGELDEALKLYLEVLRIEEKAYGRVHPEYAISLLNAGAIYRDLKKYDKSLFYLNEAKSVIQEIHGQGHWQNANVHSVIAELNHLKANYATALDFVTEAIHIASGTQISMDLDENWVNQLAQVNYQSNFHLENMIESLVILDRILKDDLSLSNSNKKRIAVADLANKLLINARNQVLNEQDKLRTLSKSHEWLLRGLRVMNIESDTKKAFSLSDQNKSVLLLESTKSEEAYRLGELPDSLVWLNKKLLKEYSELQAKLLAKSTESVKDSLRETLIGVRQDLDQFVQMIASDYPKYYDYKYQYKDVEVKNIQKLLDPNSALLEYVFGDSLVHIFYIDQKQVKWEKVQVSKEELDERIEKLRGSLNDFELKNSNRQFTANAYWFYQKLLAPVLNDVSEINNLIIVTDGELGHLPFETFLTEEVEGDFADYRDLSYLLNQFTISYNYSAALWKENIESTAPSNNGKIFAVAANYEASLDSSMLEVRLPTDQLTRSEIVPLPSARKEVEILQEKFTGYFAFDQEASEREVKGRAADYSILHFATHGILDNERPVLSSLVFTEDSDSTESNFWQAHEISKTQLNADLAVLSACETGYGKFQKGNGVASLARAFMYAGVQSLVVSLWQVDDSSTSQLMEYFYDNLADGMQKDEALRQAKLKYIAEADETLSNPAYWAPFTMIGKTDSIQLKSKYSNVVWWGLAIVVVIAGGLMRRKRKAA